MLILGKPAKITDVEEKDWVPSVNLPLTDDSTSSTSSSEESFEGVDGDSEDKVSLDETEIVGSNSPSSSGNNAQDESSDDGTSKRTSQSSCLSVTNAEKKSEHERSDCLSCTSIDKNRTVDRCLQVGGSKHIFEFLDLFIHNAYLLQIHSRVPMKRSSDTIVRCSDFKSSLMSCETSWRHTKEELNF